MMVASVRSEIYNPLTNKSCSLPYGEGKGLPSVFGRTFDHPLVCGGGKPNITGSSCFKWDSSSGTWNKSHTLKKARIYHLSWTPPSGEGTYLMGGNYGGDLTTEIVNIDGTVKWGFDLKYGIRYDGTLLLDLQLIRSSPDLKMDLLT